MNTTKTDMLLYASRTVVARAAARKAVIANAKSAYASITPTIVEWRESGLTLRQIADRLNTSGKTTREGARFKGMTVSRILARAGMTE
jgi:Recombinase